jgi:squalene-associated FAD-dependent desaturase
MTWDVVVVGGGWAGVSAVIQASRRGAKVLLIEQARYLGGRATSLVLPDGEVIDNGQHLFLGAYTETKELLEELGNYGRVEWAPGLDVAYLGNDGKVSKLTAGPGPGPLALLQGLAGFAPLDEASKSQARALGWKGAAQLLPAFFGLHAPSSNRLSVADWLKQCGQGPALQRWLWEPLCLAALNARPEQARLREFVAVLGQGFFRGGSTAGLGRSHAPLAELLAPLGEYIKLRGDIRVETFVEAVEPQGNKGVKIRLRGGEIIDSARAIVALPARLAQPLFSRDLGLKAEIERPLSAIVSVMLWTDSKLPEGILALGPESDGSQAEFHWAFQDGKRICLVASAASALAALPSAEIQVRAQALLARRLGPMNFSQIRVLKEKAATPLFAPGSAARPGNQSPWPQVTLAGDYTETGLPATIEGAVRSGSAAWNALAF